MSLRKTIGVISRLVEKGLIRHYAIAGAVAALNYLQPALTEDLDILVSIADFGKRQSGLILLTPIETALTEMGYGERAGVGYVIEGWPVQFLPVSSQLDEEALDQAVEVDIDTAGSQPVRARCLRAEHVVATALKLGRPKDRLRIEAFIAEKAVDMPSLKAILERHGLMEAWKVFCAKAGIVNPLELR